MESFESLVGGIKSLILALLEKHLQAKTVQFLKILKRREDHICCEVLMLFTLKRNQQLVDGGLTLDASKQTPPVLRETSYQPWKSPPIIQL